MTQDTTVQSRTLKPVPSVELIENALSVADLADLCDATDAAIEAGGGFGWIRLPNRDILERFWQGVVAMPARMLFVARLDGVICGAAQVIRPPKNNEVQSFAVQLTGLFISPWARGQGLSRRLLDYIEKTTLKNGYSVINLDLRETQEAAISLYESAGFQLIGEHPFYAKVDNKIVSGRYYYKVIDPSLKK
jgi:ribosomal protein S18 acetylase RimI-like enzyme